MGAKVAPTKSYNFASCSTAGIWLRETTWDALGTKIELVTDFRYLGAHLTSRQTPTSSTLEARWEQTMVQLKRLKFCPATVEAKTGIILAKTYAGALYGVEAARVTPAKVAKL